ncbi:MAG TPA: matrixin family metalloprotease [Vicinamibacterales bacterium]|nr:matrixin family metalloprotease [Vicinamibacterales bacterium]
MRRCIAATLTVLLTIGSSSPLAYLKLGAMVNGRVIDATWKQTPIGYFVSDRPGNGVSANDLAGAVERATATWSRVESASVRFTFQGMTSARAEGFDGKTTLGFIDRPDLDRVLGATSFLIDTTSGAIAEADIFFNSAFAFSVAVNGEPNRVDLESVVLHEIGHLLGLGHSAIGETERAGNGSRRVIGSGAVMFPIAHSSGAIADRVLQADDIAGISDLYPAPAALDTGGIVGRVTKNGRGVTGAHVVAFNPETGILVGNFTLNAQGDFVIARLPPGPYILRVEPLDDADPDSFFPAAIDTDFRVAYAPRMVVAPHGGSSSSIEIQVQAK